LWRRDDADESSGITRDQADRKVVDVQSLISHRFKLEELPAAMANFSNLHVSKAIIID
jgi:hypothetical protein